MIPSKGNRRKVTIAIIFATIMIFSGVGIMAFEALSQWEPTSISPFVGTGSGTTESVVDSGTSKASLGDNAGTFDVGQTVSWSGTVTVCASICEDSAQGHLYYQGNEISSSNSVDNPNGNTVSTSWSASHTFSSTGSKSWYITLSGSYSGTSGTASITVNSALSVTGISPSKTSMDIGQSITLTPSVSGGTTPYSYSWSETGASGSFSSTTASAPTWTASGTGTASFSLTVTDAAGDTGSASTSVTVDSDPSIAISSNINPSDIGQSVDFSTSTSGGTGDYTSYSYVLYDGTSTSDSQLASGTSSSFSYTFSSSGQYLLDYSVTDSNGYKATNSLTQTVNTDPSVSISSSQNPTDVGKSITLTADESGGTGTPSYQWYLNSAAISGATSSTYSTSDYSSSGTYDYYVSVTDEAGYTVSSNTIDETVNSDPTVSASSNVSTADVNYPIEFSSSPSGGTSPYTYSWTIGGTQVSTSQDFSYSFSSAGSYTVEVTVTDSIGETYSSSVSVTINNNPSVSVSSSQNPTDVGNSVTFSASESGGTGTISYAWTVNGASEGSGSTLDYSFSSSGSYTIEVTVTDSDGHVATSSITETVYVDPSVSISSSQNPTDVGNSVTFTASPSGGSGSYTYQWYLNSAAVSGATSSTYSTSFSSSGTDSIYVIIKDSIGNSAQSSTLTETVNADPSVSITSSQNPTDVGNSVTFTATGSGGTGSYSYQWYENSTAISGATSSTYTTSFPYSGSPTFYVIIKDANGNSAQSSTLTETVNADPSVSISSSQNPTDVGNSVTFTASGSGGTGAYSYTWYLNGATQSSTTSSYDNTFSSAGKYYVNVTVKDSLGNSGFYSFIETVNPDPSVTIQSTPAPTDVGVPVTFSSSPMGGTSPYNYTWTINSVIVSYSSSFSHTFTSSGTYSVQLTIKDANGNTASAVLNETVNADPTVSITPEYSTVDQEINDSLTANVNGGTYPFNYTWYVGSQIVNYSQSFHYAFPDVATYTVKVVVADSLGQNTTDSVTIDSIHRPSVSVNGPNNTDLKVPTTFIGNATYGSAPYNYTWEINQVSVGYGLYLTYSFPSTGTFNVTLKATDSQGDVAYGYLNEVVHQLPVVSITSSKSTGDVGFTDTFSSTVSGGTTPYTEEWYAGGNEVGSQPILTYTFSSQGTILVRLVIVDGAGVSANAETNVTVNALPTVSISAKYLAIDTGIQDTFNATGSFGTAPYNYTWYVNNVIEGYGASLQYSFSSSGSQAVKVVLRDADGNTATSIASVQVYAPPIPSILANRTTIDQGMGVQFLSGVSGGVGPYNYTWSIGGGLIGYGSIIDHKFLDAGTYYVNLTVSDSFGSTGHTSIAISVNAPMSVIISQSATKLDSGQSATFTPHVSGGISPYHYIWEVNSLVVSTQSNLTYIFTSSGTYEVYLQATDAVGTVSNATVSITVYPDLSATISAEYPTVDQNITDNITLHPSNGTAPYTFYIAIDEHAVSSDSTYSQYFTSPGTYYVSAYVNDSSGESVHLASTIVVRSDPSVIITTPTNRTDANVPIQFRGVLSGGTGPYSYSWLIGGHTYNGTTLSHSFASAGNYTIQLTVSDAFGREAIANLNETVYSDPHATLIAPSYIRASREIPLALNISGGIPSYKIQWYFPSGEQFSGKNITHAFISAGPETFEAQVTDSTGYVDTQNFTVNVHLYVAIAANTTSGLAPLPVQFSSSVLGGSDYSYNWTFSPGHYSLLQNPVYQFQEGNYTVNFHVTSSNGATGEENLTITSLPPPVTFSYSPHTNGTILTTFHFSATPNWDASSPYSMSWSFPNGQSLTGMNVSYQFPVYHEFNTVIATFTYDNGKTWTQDLSVRLYPAPIKASFSIPKIIPSGTLVNVTGVAQDPDSTSITYSWVFDGQAYSGQNQFFYFGNVGNYTISLTATDSLGATDTVTHVVKVENVTSNANIVIKVNTVSNGPYDLYHIRILSSAPIDIVEAFISSQSLQPVYVNDTDGYNYNLTLNQQDYAPGTYPLKIVVFTTTGESNFVTETFFVSQTYGKGGAPFSLASFFGGSLNMILALVSITASISGVIFFWRDKKDKDTRYFNIGGTMVKGKVSPMSKYSFSKHTENNSQVPPSNNIPPSNPGEGNNGNNGNFGNNGGFF